LVTIAGREKFLRFIIQELHDHRSDNHLRYRLTGDLIRDAALGGLAATVRGWERRLLPEGLTFRGGSLSGSQGALKVKVGTDTVEVDGDLSLGIKAAFCLAKGLIWLPGLGMSDEASHELLPIHQQLMVTFLQHFQKKGLGTERVAVVQVDEETIPLSYRECTWYAHQKPFRGKVTQDLVPGVTEGALALPSTPEEEFLLRFLCVACPVFSVHSGDDRFRSCIVVPRVSDLRKFADDVPAVVEG
jgi:hypothetical protein